MTPRRVAAATAAILTVLVLQATLFTPLTAPLAVSLPAILVAAVGITAGPSAGMSMGFSAGLLADLGSHHPAGVLALAWLLLGLVCGLFADPRRRARTAIVVASIATAMVSLVTVVALGLLDAPSGSLASELRLAVPTAAGDTVLAVLVVPAVRVVVRALRVRAGRPAAATQAAVSATSRVAVDG